MNNHKHTVCTNYALYFPLFELSLQAEKDLSYHAILKTRFYAGIIFEIIWPDFAKNIPHSGYHDESQTFLDIVRNILQLLFVSSWEQNSLNSGTMSRQDFMFHTTNRQHMSP